MANLALSLFDVHIALDIFVFHRQAKEAPLECKTVNFALYYGRNCSIAKPKSPMIQAGYL